MHWDHAGGIDLFPDARIWIQKDEYDYYTSDAWQSRTHPRRHRCRRCAGDREAEHRRQSVVRARRRRHDRCRGSRSASAASTPGSRSSSPSHAARAHDRPRVRQHVPLREPRHAHADRADARRGIEPAHAGSDEDRWPASRACSCPATIRRCSIGFRTSAIGSSGSNRHARHSGKWRRASTLRVRSPEACPELALRPAQDERRRGRRHILITRSGAPPSDRASRRGGPACRWRAPRSQSSPTTQQRS